MAGITNINRLEEVNSIVVQTAQVHCDNPNGVAEVLPKKAIYTNTGDGGGYEFLGVRDNKFAVVQNQMLFESFNDASYDLGIDLEVDRATYHPNGATRVDFIFPGREYTVPGDDSKVVPGISTSNHFNGGGKIKGLPFNKRLVCSNRMTMNFYDLASAVSRMHVGQIKRVDLYDIAAQVLQNADDALEVIQLTTTIAAQKHVTDEQVSHFLDSVEKKMAKKYHELVRNVVTDNMNTIGQTAWGFIQGISEVYEHHMDQTRNREEWRDNTINEFLQSSGVVQEVMARR